MRTNTKTIQMPFEIKSLDENGAFTGYGSVFNNEDSYGDIVRPGAFEKSLEKWAGKGRLPPVLWQHDTRQPIGVFTKMQEDQHGLYVEGRLLVDAIPQARAAHALLKEKVLGGMSIGYREIKTAWNREDSTQDLLELDLWEVSIVTFPANEAATVDSVKADFSDGLPDLSEFEKFLRDAGFSKTQATAIASHGLRQLLRDAEPDPEAKQIQSVLNILKGNKQ